MQESGGYFGRVNSGMLVATFFSLWLAVYLENRIEDTLGYILILSFGILHGANDIKLLQTTTESDQKTLGFFRILTYYVLFVLTVAGLFYFIPAIALALFILFSAYHFGEQHWVALLGKNSWNPWLFYTSYGLFILFLLFSAHKHEVSDIVLAIGGLPVNSELYSVGLLLSGGITVLIYLVKIKQYSSRLILEIFYLAVFYIVFNTASLLWGFAIYFIIWHSIPSLADQIDYLYGDFNRVHFLKYLRSSFVYWIAAVLSLLLIFTYSDHLHSGFMPLLFSFLAAITFPHVFVIRKLNKR